MIGGGNDTLTMTHGFVSLVGAGPGHPDLLTVRAVDRLRNADLVLYDALVAPEVVALAEGAQRFCVGKRAGRKSVQQGTILRVMMRAAKRGRRVVRLKCGDPYVLGRGAEEASALRTAGIPFEVVQGVTTAVAAPAAAGIPVTHRGLASGFVVVSGHDEKSFLPVLASLTPNTLTVVILMGLSNRQAIAACLLKHGWRPDTPAAVIFAASTPREWTWIGSLTDLRNARLDDSDPGTIVVGSVVNLHDAALGNATTPIAVVAEGKS